ncbi:hypothetical protein [Auraticoccus monumenti]|uniref:Secreted protein n=1 Tax=Auraticoccus monumenti TaxID=675864 RepID=A0A1G7CN27_9ACTN|nr:hypothetical protein [Auraticoccus monumenti]SDE40643.1 hypothetical protein SAMN04489747_3320 [Auraticoccus monumenti]
MTVISSTRPLAAGLAALALTLGLGLTGCSTGDEAAQPDATGSDTTTSQPETAPSEAPSETPSETPSEAPSEDASTDSGESGGKPSKEEVATGLNDLVAEMSPGASEASGDVLEKLTTCAVDKIYDTASEKSLQAIAEGDLSGADPDDLTDLSNAISECSTEVVG